MATAFADFMVSDWEGIDASDFIHHIDSGRLINDASRIVGFFRSSGGDVPALVVPGATASIGISADRIEFIGYDKETGSTVRGFSTNVGLSAGISPFDARDGNFNFTGSPDSLGGHAVSVNTSLFGGGGISINPNVDFMSTVNLGTDAETSIALSYTSEVWVDENKIMGFGEKRVSNFPMNIHPSKALWRYCVELVTLHSHIEHPLMMAASL